MTTIDLGQVRAAIFGVVGDSVAEGGSVATSEGVPAAGDSAGEGDAFIAGLDRPAADLYRRLQLRGVPTAVVGLGVGGATGPVDSAADVAPGAPPLEAALVDAARRLGADPATAAVVAGTQAAAEAARRAGFATVSAGPADVDLQPVARALSTVPDGLAAWGTVAALLRGRPLAVFLDFDGTLSPIVDRPDDARMTPSGGPALERLAALCPVAIVSGRDLGDVRRRAGVPSLWYAGSHGFEYVSPDGEAHEHEQAGQAVAALAEAEQQLSARLRDLPGAIVENKRFALAAHYRMVAEERANEVIDAVAEVGAQYPMLRMTGGRKVAELRPNIDWDKGKALHWLLEQIAPGGGDVLPLYAGDDLTDEDALTAIGERGFGVVVRNYELGDRPTAAHVGADDPEEFCAFLERVADLLEEG